MIYFFFFWYIFSYISGALGIECERAGVVEYAGLCQMGVGRCEAALGHSGNAAWALRTAGRHFLKVNTLPLIAPHTDRLEVNYLYICILFLWRFYGDIDNGHVTMAHKKTLGQWIAPF